jgi:hypothetical protein
MINLHQLPTSHQETDIDDNRPMTLSWSFLSVLRRLIQRRPCPDINLPMFLLYITLTTLHTSVSLVSMTNGMVLLKAFDDDTRMRTRQHSSLVDKK